MPAETECLGTVSRDGPACYPSLGTGPSAGSRGYRRPGCSARAPLPLLLLLLRPAPVDGLDLPRAAKETTAMMASMSPGLSCWWNGFRTSMPWAFSGVWRAPLPEGGAMFSELEGALGNAKPRPFKIPNPLICSKVSGPAHVASIIHRISAGLLLG